MAEFVEQAGAITFKNGNDIVEVLLVRSKKDPSKWIFPKGHIESGESALNAAERELLEEAGVIGSALRNIGVLYYSTNDKNYRITYFITEFLATDNQGEPGREPTWFSFEQALEHLSFQDMKDLLTTAVTYIQSTY